MTTWWGPSTWVDLAAITASTFNQQIRDNFNHLKNAAQVTYQSDYVMPPYRREVQILWEGATTTSMQINAQATDTGTVLIAGSGQVVLQVGNGASGSARIDQTTAASGALSNNWNTTHNPYFRQEFAINSATTSLHMFLGLRTSSGISEPTTENHFGLHLSGSTWHASCANGVTQTDTTASDALRPALSARHVVETSLHNSSNIYFMIDGSTWLTLATNVPSSSMLRFSLGLYSTGNGTTEAALVTLGATIMQESGGF